MSAPARVQLATLDRFILGWSKWSAAEMVETWTADCTLSTLPFSLNHPPRTRSQVETTLPLLQNIVTNYELEIHEIVHDAPRSKAVVYAISKGQTPFGPWTNEYSVFFTFDESGNRIVKIEEMVDSAFMGDFLPKFQGYLAKLQQEAKKEAGA